jgi:hypothetical protein
MRQKTIEVITETALWFLNQSYNNISGRHDN